MWLMYWDNCNVCAWCIPHVESCCRVSMGASCPCSSWLSILCRQINVHASSNSALLFIELTNIFATKLLKNKKIELFVCDKITSSQFWRIYIVFYLYFPEHYQIFFLRWTACAYDDISRWIKVAHSLYSCQLLELSESEQKIQTINK